MFRFTARNILRNVIQRTNWSSLDAVTSRSYTHSGSEMENNRYHYSAESEKTKLNNFNVKPDTAKVSSNPCVDIQTIIHRHSNNLEEEIPCNCSRGESEEMTTNVSHTEHNVISVLPLSVIPRSDSICSFFDIDSADKTPSDHCHAKSDEISICSSSYVESANVMSESDLPLEPKVVTTQSQALAKSAMFMFNSDSCAEYVVKTLRSDSNIETLDVKSYCHSLGESYETQILSLAHAEPGNKSACIESDDVTSQNLSYAKSETMVVDNIIFHMLTNKEKSHHNNMVSEDMKDSVSYTDSEMVIPDLESKMEIPDNKFNAKSNKDNSSRIRIIPEEMLDSVAFADSELIIPNQQFTDESTRKSCCSNVESEVMARRSDFHEVPMVISSNSIVANVYPSPGMDKDSNTKPSFDQLNEEYDIMDEFLNHMKEYVQNLTQEELLNMLKIKEFGPYFNPYAGELGGPKGPEPTRYGDWEIWGKCVDF